MEVVYQALRLTALRIPEGSFQLGTRITAQYGLKNTLDRELRPPLDRTWLSTPGYFVGAWQGWIERLGKDADIPTFPRRTVRQGRRYAAGGAVLTVGGNLPQGHTISLTATIETKGYPPGRYRYFVEYRDLADRILQMESVEFDLVAPLPLGAPATENKP